jgi:hypothetical protein
MAKYHRAWFLAVLVSTLPGRAFAWFDETHSAVMRAADTPYSDCLSIAADALVEKWPIEAANHWFNGDANQPVTEARVTEQVTRYNTLDPAGHLYGAVVAAWRRVVELLQQGRRPAYAFGFLAHYIGDLSQPLHQSANDAFNKAHHLHIDGIVNDRVDLEAQIRRRMVPVAVNNEADLIREVVRVASASLALDANMRRGTVLTEEDAYRQLASSAALLRAITVHLPQAQGAAPPNTR